MFSILYILVTIEGIELRSLELWINIIDETPMIFEASLPKIMIVVTPVVSLTIIFNLYVEIKYSVNGNYLFFFYI